MIKILAITQNIKQRKYTASYQHHHSKSDWNGKHPARQIDNQFIGSIYKEKSKFQHNYYFQCRILLKNHDVPANILRTESKGNGGHSLNGARRRPTQQTGHSPQLLCLAAHLARAALPQPRAPVTAPGPETAPAPSPPRPAPGEEPCALRLMHRAELHVRISEERGERKKIIIKKIYLSK